MYMEGEILNYGIILREFNIAIKNKYQKLAMEIKFILQRNETSIIFFNSERYEKKVFVADRGDKNTDYPTHKISPFCNNSLLITNKVNSGTVVKNDIMQWWVKLKINNNLEKRVWTHGY